MVIFIYRTKYDAFGTLLSQTGNVSNSYLYAGYQYDAETGLYYLNARMYDSVTARFIQEDTYRGNPNDPLSLNLYTYCANNPLIYHDPTGHWREWLDNTGKWVNDAGKWVKDTSKGLYQSGVDAYNTATEPFRIAKAYLESEYKNSGMPKATNDLKKAVGNSPGGKALNRASNYISAKPSEKSGLSRLTQVLFGGIGKGIASFVKDDIIGGIKSLYNLANHPIQTGKDLTKKVEKINNVIKNPDILVKNFDAEKTSKLILNTFGTEDGYLDYQQNKIALETRIGLNIATDILIGQGIAKGATKAKIPEPPRALRNMDDVLGKGGSSASNEVYAGVKEASEYLKSQNVPRQYRKQILESFDVRTIKIETASDETYGIRFYGGDAQEKGRYLFETFSPTTNRNNLALPHDWNTMTGLQQFQVKSGTPMITGNAAPQLNYGSQYVGGAKQWYINSLEALSK